MKASAVNKLAAVRIGVNASSLSRTEISRFIASVTDMGAVAVGSTVVLNPNDKASLMMTNATDTTGLEVAKVIFTIQEQV